MQKKEATLANVKADLLSRQEWLDEVEAVGIFGSLARDDFDERSDIDVFVVIEKCRPSVDDEALWWKRVSDLLTCYRRDKMVLVYDIKSLKDVCTWYVLRLASEGMVLYDKGRVAPLLRRIVEKARACGLVEKEHDGRKVWEMDRPVKPGERIEIRITDDE